MLWYYHGFFSFYGLVLSHFLHLFFIQMWSFKWRIFVLFGVCFLGISAEKNKGVSPYKSQPPIKQHQSLSDGIKKTERYAILKSSVVNWRQGPGKNHPVIWHYTQCAGWPVIIEREKNHWYYVRDFWGSRGWVLGQMLNFSCAVIAMHDTPLHVTPDDKALSPALLKKGVVGKILSVMHKDKGQQWYKIIVTSSDQKVVGWALATFFWPKILSATLQDQSR